MINFEQVLKNNFLRVFFKSRLYSNIIGFFFLTSVLSFSTGGKAKSPSLQKNDDKPFTVLWKKPPDTLNPVNMPLSVNNSVDSQAVFEESLIGQKLIHCSLFTDREKNLPYIVEQWKWLDSFLSLEIKIKRNFKFSDGTPLTAKDIIETANRLQVQLNQTIESKDPYILTIKLKTPDYSLLQKLQFGILSEKWLKSDKSDDDYNMPSCGPYMLDRFSNTDLVLKRNPYFPGPEVKTTSLPLKNISIKIVPSEINRLEELKKGNIDLAANVFSYERFGDVAKKMPLYAISYFDRPAIQYLGFNLKDTFLSNRLIRKSIAQGIDREKIVRSVFKRFATPILSLFSPPVDNEDIRLAEFPPYSLEGAKKGLPPLKIHVKFGVALNAADIAAGKAICTELNDLGIESELVILEPKQFENEILNGTLSMWLSSWDQSLMCRRTFPTPIPSWESDIASICNMQYTRKQEELIQTFQKKMSEDFVAIPLWRLNHLIVRNKKRKHWNSFYVTVPGTLTGPSESWFLP